MVTINSDLGESLGNYSFGNDDGLLTVVDVVNVACGFHAGDPTAMQETVAKAAAAKVQIGAHPGLPDIVGFGRREMALTGAEVRSLVLYQVGALVGFLKSAGANLNHIKPHGALYGMAARNEEVADAIAECAELYDVDLYGMAGTAHARAAEKHGVAFVPELYVDVQYDDDGELIVARRPVPTPVERALTLARSALRDGVVPSASGRPVPVEFRSICVHSDTPNAVEVAQAIHELVAAA